MIRRVDSFFEFLDIPAQEREAGMRAAAAAGERAQGMTHARDYEALAAVLLYARPRRIFEIGTYLGITSNFFLQLLPQANVVSIAYVRFRWPLFGRRYNNSELTREQVGSRVEPEFRSRYVQLYGDSHKLNAGSLLERFGRFDMVFIDGDHSREGVKRDTALALGILSEKGVICWHDANPKPAYKDVRDYLERELDLPAVATRDDYFGGVACWSRALEERALQPAA
jgi:predicted O-methyltransferase YrrM